MCYVNFDDSPSCWNERKQKARKEHRCSCCHATIQVGETYVYQFWISDGDPCKAKSCLACEEIANVFGKEHDGQRPFADSLRSFVDECIADGDEDSQRWQPMLDAIDARRAAAEAAR